jgi:carbamoyltransferase
MYILGLSFFATDSAAALLHDGQLIATAVEARFSGTLHDGAFPAQAIAFCLQTASIDEAALDYVVFYEKPLLKFERMLITTLGTFPRSRDLWRETVFSWLPKKLWVKSLIESRVKVHPAQILFCDHAMAHAASAFFSSPFGEAAIMTVDTVGEWTTSALGQGQGNTLTLFAEQRFPHSLGLFAATFSTFFGGGDAVFSELAVQGTPRYVDKVRQVCQVQPDGSITLDLTYFAFPYSTREWYTARFSKLFGAPGVTMPYAADLAASVQVVIEDALVRMARTLHTRTGLDKLCLAGSMALNQTAIEKIKSDMTFNAVYMPAAPGDDGAALGAALWAHHMIFEGARAVTAVVNGAYLPKPPEAR